MEILINGNYENFISEDEINNIAKLILEHENNTLDFELSIFFTDNETIRNLNSKYRKIDKATNVLSFSMREGEKFPFQNILGDVVISLEKAEEEAKKENLKIKDKIVILLIHGILHLLGYDHVLDKDYLLTYNKENFYYNIWKGIGKI